jgi:hypothetical protein
VGYISHSNLCIESVESQHRRNCGLSFDDFGNSIFELVLSLFSPTAEVQLTRIFSFYNFIHVPFRHHSASYFAKMKFPTRLLVAFAFSLPALSQSCVEIAPRAEKTITFNKGTDYEMITEIKKSQVNIQNLCCYECGSSMCCCNFDPASERCNQEGCVPTTQPSPPPEPSSNLGAGLQI